MSDLPWEWRDGHERSPSATGQAAHITSQPASIPGRRRQSLPLPPHEGRERRQGHASRGEAAGNGGCSADHPPDAGQAQSRGCRGGLRSGRGVPRQVRPCPRSELACTLGGCSLAGAAPALFRLTRQQGGHPSRNRRRGTRLLVSLCSNTTFSVSPTASLKTVGWPHARL